MAERVGLKNPTVVAKAAELPAGTALVVGSASVVVWIGRHAVEAFGAAVAFQTAGIGVAV